MFSQFFVWPALFIGHILCNPVKKAPEVQSVEYRLTSPPADNPTGYVVSVIINYRSNDNERKINSEGQDEQEKVPPVKGKFGHKDPYGRTYEVFYVAGEGDFETREEAFLASSTTAAPLPPPRPFPTRPPPLPPRRAPSNKKSKPAEITTTTWVPPTKQSPIVERGLLSSCQAILTSCAG